jgi:hypothetical protein
MPPLRNRIQNNSINKVNTCGRSIYYCQLKLFFAQTKRGGSSQIKHGGRHVTHLMSVEARRAKAEADPWTVSGSVTNKKLLCRGCLEECMLDSRKDRDVYLANWNRHKLERCYIIRIATLAQELGCSVSPASVHIIWFSRGTYTTAQVFEAKEVIDTQREGCQNSAVEEQAAEKQGLEHRTKGDEPTRGYRNGEGKHVRQHNAVSYAFDLLQPLFMYGNSPGWKDLHLNTLWDGPTCTHTRTIGTKNEVAIGLALDMIPAILDLDKAKGFIPPFESMAEKHRAKLWASTYYPLPSN